MFNGVIVNELQGMDQTLGELRSLGTVSIVQLSLLKKLIYHGDHRVHREKLKYEFEKKSKFQLKLQGFSKNIEKLSGLRVLCGETGFLQ